MTKERGILYQAAMVRAILEGRKTQTRRIVKHQAMEYGGKTYKAIAFDFKRGVMTYDYVNPRTGENAQRCAIKAPLGQPGDRLWVRESYYQFGFWMPLTSVKTKGGRQKWKFIAEYEDILFEAPANNKIRLGRHRKDPLTAAWHKRLGRFMPRHYSRLSLELTADRVERLQDISEADAYDEGVTDSWPKSLPYISAFGGRAVINNYAALWKSINGPGSWEFNPFVWVYEFKIVNKESGK